MKFCKNRQTGWWIFTRNVPDKLNKISSKKHTKLYKNWTKIYHAALKLMEMEQKNLREIHRWVQSERESPKNEIEIEIFMNMSPNCKMSLNGLKIDENRNWTERVKLGSELWNNCKKKADKNYVRVWMLKCEEGRSSWSVGLSGGKNNESSSGLITQSGRG